MVKSLVLSLVLMLSAVSAVSAQSPFPGGVLINGGWVPCSHPIAIDAGQGCTGTHSSAPDPNTTGNGYPYVREPMQIGRVYGDAYRGTWRVIAVVAPTTLPGVYFLLEQLDPVYGGVCGRLAYRPVEAPQGAWISRPDRESVQGCPNPVDQLLP